jgi:hypothetical protein
MNKLLILICVVNFVYPNNIKVNPTNLDIVKINIINDSSYNIDSIMIKDYKNNIIFTKNIYCQDAIGSSCYSELDKYYFNKIGSNLFFYNGNKLVAVYTNKIQFGQDAYIDVDLGNTGIYVINKMRSLNLTVNYDNIINFIDKNFDDVSFDKVIDALGFYYLHYLQDSINEDKFINELYLKINSTDSIEHQKLTLPVLKTKQNNLNTFSQNNNFIVRMNNPYTPKISSIFCFSKFQATMDLINAVNFSNVPALGIITGLFKAVADISCHNAAVNFSTELNKINAKLDETNGKLDIISSDIGKFNQEWRQGKVNTYNSHVEKSINQIATLLDSYYFSLSSHKLNKNILEDFVIAKGGIEKAKQDPIFSANINRLVNNSVNLINLYKNMPVDSQNIRDYLNEICNNPDTIPTEVIATRLWCDSHLLEVYTKLKVTATTVENFYTDFNQVFKSYPGMAILTKADINRVEQQIEKFSPDNYPYIVNILDGLDPNLVNNIKSIPACTVNNMPNIEKWQAKATSKSPYIVVKCYGNKEDNIFKDLIASKYYYLNTKTNTTDSNVINVLGVLAPKQFFQNTDDAITFNQTNWLNQSNCEFKVGRDDSIISGNYYVPITTVVNNVNKFNVTSSSIFPSANSNYFIRDGKTYYVFEFVPQPSDIVNSIKLRVSYPRAYYWLRSPSNYCGFSSHSFILMRTIYEGYGYVWLNRVRLYRNWEINGDTFYYQTFLQCMTYDCKTSADQLKQLVMEYDSTKPVKISFRGVANEMTSNINQFMGTYYTNNKLYINDKQAF